MSFEKLLQELGGPIQSPEEETFELFAQGLPSSQNLGFIDPKAAVLDLAIAGRDLTIHQSPGVLSSNRAGGTTGAVIWKITPLFAEWISNPHQNPLFTYNVLSSESLVLELGCGISGLVALLLAPRISRFVLTDQPYVAKFIEQNIEENHHSNSHSSSSKGSSNKKAKSTKNRGGKHRPPNPAPAVPGHSGARGIGNGDREIHFTPLDWETDEVTPALTGQPQQKSFDVVVACDCIYNEALVGPLVSACADVCKLRSSDSESEGATSSPCVCVIAQQLRNDQVFETWMMRFCESFDAWRVPDQLLTEGLRLGSGFVVHIGVLKGCL